MDSTENHIKQITEIVESEGYEAYDIQLSHRRNGVVRIFITAPLSNKELVPTLDACSRISRKLLDHPNVEELIPWDSTLEVSSPGINRKIKTLNNAKGAVGERVSIKYKSADGKNEVIKGVLLEVLGDELLIEREVEKKKKAKKVKTSALGEESLTKDLPLEKVNDKLKISFESIVEAKVDFKF